MAGQFSEAEGMAMPVRMVPAFREVAGRFDALTGGSFERWVTVEPQALLSEHTVASQAVVLFDAALGTVASERFGPPSLVAGYSLGFYAAASLAGVFPMDVALEWIRRVNRAMDLRFPPGTFGLAVSIGLTREELLSAFAGASLGGLEVANINNARQLVFAGPAAEMDAALKALEGRVLSAKALPLGFPLHTSYLRPVAEEIEPWWRGVPLSDPHMPLLSPVDGSSLTDAGQVRETMLLSLTEPTDWVSVVKAAGSLGPAWVLDSSGDGSLGRMTRWVDRAMRVVPYREALAGGGPP
jgi:malonyl CoA-acyl carrier protein transacylase